MKIIHQFVTWTILGNLVVSRDIDLGRYTSTWRHSLHPRLSAWANIVALLF